MAILKLKLIKTSLKKIGDLPKEVWWYIFYGFFCLVLFIYIRFPYQKLQDNLLAKLSENLSLSISVREKSFKFPLGFRWKDIKLSKAGSDSQGSNFRIDELRVGLNLIPLIVFRKSLYIKGETLGGEIEGNLTIKGNEYQIEEETIKELDLSKIYPPRNSIESKLAGKMNSSFNLSVPQEGFSLSNGKAFINLKGLGIENFWPMLPKISISELKSEIKFLKGRGTIKTLEATGDDIKITGRGSLDLANSLMESRMNINLQVTTKGKSIFGKLISAIGKGKGKGFIPVVITGNLSKPLIKIAGVPL